MSEVQQIPFDRLHPSPMNPRHGVPNPAAIAELAVSIEKDGILENLLARPLAGREGHFELVAGHRRHQAFGVLVKDGKKAKTDPLPVRTKAFTDLEALRIATVENVQRQMLAPLEEADAFAGMVKLGDTPENIAALTGFSVKKVEQRIAIAKGLAPVIRKAMEAGRINLAQAQAFTIGSVARQEKLFKSFSQYSGKNEPLQHDAGQIRDHLTERQLAVKDALFAPEFYQGEITRDLFDDKNEGGYYADWEQAEKLQLAAAEEKREKFLADGWKWAEINRGHFSDWLYGKSDDKTKAGVVIQIDSDLSVKFHTRLIKPEERRRETSAQTRPGKPANRDPLSGTHMVWAYHAKTRALQDAVSKDPAVAVSLAIIGLLNGYAEVHDVKIERHRLPGMSSQGKNPALNKHIGAVLKPVAKFLEASLEEDDRPGDLDFRGGKETEAFAVLMKMKPQARLDILSALVAAQFGAWTYDGKNYGDTDLVLAVAKQLKVTHGVAPTDADYLGKLNRAQLGRFAIQAGIPSIEVPAIVAKKKAAAVAEILAHPKRNKAFVPPELRFLEEKKLRQALAVPKATKAKTERWP
jgi:ParB/RepB/Spo0J family partition protein